MRSRLRLRRELDLIRGAVEAARILGEALATDQLGPDEDHRRAPRAITSLLALVGERLDVLRRAARRGGEVRHRKTCPAVRGAWMSPGERVLARIAMRQRASAA